MALLSYRRHIEASEKTIALKTPIKSCGDENARCSGSSRLDPRSGFSTSIPAVHNTLNHQRHLISRSTIRIFRAEAAARWQDAVAVA
jgi:hypothetical protein